MQFVSYWSKQSFARFEQHLKTAEPTKMLWHFLSSSDNLLQKNHIFFQKKKYW